LNPQNNSPEKRKKFFFTLGGPKPPTPKFSTQYLDIIETHPRTKFHLISPSGYRETRVHGQKYVFSHIKMGAPTPIFNGKKNKKNTSGHHENTPPGQISSHFAQRLPRNPRSRTYAQTHRRTHNDNLNIPAVATQTCRDNNTCFVTLKRPSFKTADQKNLKFFLQHVQIGTIESPKQQPRKTKKIFFTLGGPKPPTPKIFNSVLPAPFVLPIAKISRLSSKN
jgi:hypothetical protein